MVSITFCLIVELFLFPFFIPKLHHKLFSHLFRFFTQQSIRYSVRRMSFQQQFVVRRLKTPEEVHDIIFSTAANECWRPGALDHASFFAADSKRFFVGELNGKPITSAFLVKYSYDYMYAGGFLVDHEHRGRGYGVHMSRCIFSLTNHNIGADATFEILPFVAKFGFKPQWCIQCFDIAASSTYVNCSKSTKIVPSSKEFFPALLDYDTQVHVFPRPMFLKNWVFAPNCHCLVALNDCRDVVGYGVIRTVLREDNGWRIGPLFADNSTIARELLQDMIIKVSSSYLQAVITMDVSYGKYFNSDSLRMVAELGGIPTFQMMRVYKYGAPPNMPLHKVYVMT